MTRHFILPDTQVRPGVPLEHLTAAGNYIVDKQPETIIHLGDHADMPSLSQYESPGSKITEGQRYSDDVQAALLGMDTLLSPLHAYNSKRRRFKMKQYNPRMVFLMGNHEDRIDRAIKINPRHYEGVISTSDLQYEKFGWEVSPFLRIVEIDGILYSHYFVNPHSAKKGVIGGTIETCIKNVGHSFTMGHQQGRKYGSLHFGEGTERHGLIAGSFYQHDEHYMGEQGNASHWRGCIMKNEVKDGAYDAMFLSLQYLLEQWT